MKGVDPSFCQRKIKLKKVAVLVVQQRYRMNPNYAKQVKEELDKILKIGFIYPCQRDDRPNDASKMPHQPLLPLGPFQFIGPIKPCAKYTHNQYILVATHYCSKWVRVVALGDNKAINISTKFGVPMELFLDRRTNLINKVIKRQSKTQMMLHLKYVACSSRGDLTSVAI